MISVLCSLLRFTIRLNLWRVSVTVCEHLRRRWTPAALAGVPAMLSVWAVELWAHPLCLTNSAAVSALQGLLIPETGPVNDPPQPCVYFLFQLRGFALQVREGHFRV